jgi:hypothetical protein
MSFDPFKSSTVGPEALQARLELEKRLKEQRERDKANRLRDKERRDYNLAIAAEDSKNYEMEGGTEEGGVPGGSPFSGIPKLSRGNMASLPGGDKKFQIAANNTPSSNPAAAKTSNGFRLKRF